MIKLTLHPEQTIESLKDQFNKEFPFLNLECFSHPHGEAEGSAKKKVLSVTTPLSACMKPSAEITIGFHRSDTVRKFEELLKKSAGLNVQVFRKSGNVWLETTTTDGWTLEQQNEEGRISAEKIKEEIESADDHDIY